MCREQLVWFEANGFITWHATHGIMCECAICDRTWAVIANEVRMFREAEFGKAGLEDLEGPLHLPFDQADVVPLDGGTFDDR